MKRIPMNESMMWQETRRELKDTTRRRSREAERRIAVEE